MNTSQVLEQIIQSPSSPKLSWIQLPIEYAKIVSTLSQKLDSEDLRSLIELGRQLYQASDPLAQTSIRDSSKTA